MMVGIEATIDQGDVARFSDVLSQYADALGKQSSTAPRRAAIMICKSFRKATKPAKKNKGMSAMKDNTSGKSKWLTYSHGRKLEKPLRRWKVNLTDRGRWITRYVFEDDARKQLRQQVGTNYYQSERKDGVRGLAKQSWGWVMHNIFNGAAPDTPWNRRKHDTINPKELTRESYSSNYKDGGIARICNRLNYIVDALKGFSMNDAVEKAVKWMLSEVERRKI